MAKSINRCRRLYGRRLKVETLEDRQLLSSAPGIAGAPDQLPTISHTDLADAEAALMHFLQGHTQTVANGLSLAKGGPRDSTGAFLSTGDPLPTVELLLRNGDGTFQRARGVISRVNGGSVVEGDFNWNGIPDFAFVNDKGRVVELLLSNGDGTFTTQGSPHLQARDFNHDGIPDLITDSPRKRTQPKVRLFADSTSDLSAIRQQVESKRVVARIQGAILAYLEDGAEAAALAEAGTPPESPASVGQRGIGAPEAELTWLPPPLPAIADQAAEPVAPVVHEEADGSEADAVPTAPLAPAPPLLAGLLPTDVAALGRKVDAFFSRVANLTEDATAACVHSRLVPWLLTGAATAAAFAVARHHLRRGTGDGDATAADRRSREWTWFADSAVLPPWDRS